MCNSSFRVDTTCPIALLTLATLCAAAVPSLAWGQVTAESDPQAQDPHVPSGYHLAWSDEFDQEGTLDPRSWTFERGFVRNRELQYYQEENASCSDGVLSIVAKQEQVKNAKYRQGDNNWQRTRPTAEYTSACVKTMGRKAWQYGYFEVRAKIPAEPGLWPAIWMLGVERPWPQCGEIDLMEYYDRSILANAAYAPDGGWKPTWDESKSPIAKFGPQWEDQWHIWRMLWTKQEIHLSVDEHLLNTVEVEAATSRDGFNPFRQPHYLLLNLAIGGMQGGDPRKVHFPRSFEVDYVRVYKLKAPLQTGR